jgi:hypothetical protein
MTSERRDTSQENGRNNTLKPLSVGRLLKSYAWGRTWDAGRVCAGCGQRYWAARTLRGRVFSHLNARGKFERCAAFSEPVYSCECGRQRRGWSGPPRGWTQIQGFSALCTTCSKPKRTRKAVADVTA